MRKLLRTYAVKASKLPYLRKLENIGWICYGGDKKRFIWDRIKCVFWGGILVAIISGCHWSLASTMFNVWDGWTWIIRCHPGKIRVRMNPSDPVGNPLGRSWTLLANTTTPLICLHPHG